MKLKLESRNVRIELIPLIDIIFLLLVFFIYSMLSMVVYRGIPVQLPEADSTETEREQVLVITIDTGGGIYVDQQGVSRRDLLSTLSDVHEVTPNKSVIISGDGEADYQVFVDVLDKVRLAGFKSVSMEARPREEGP